MGFRFWRRIRLLPGLTLNLSKSGASLSFGRRGARYTIGSRGRRATVGVPGTGLFYTVADGDGRRRGPSRGRVGPDAPASPPGPVARPEDRLTLGFFRRLVTPEGEERFVDGCRALALGDEKEALEQLEGALDTADAAYLAGFLALKREQLDRGARCLRAAERNHRRLGRHFEKYGISATLSLPVTEEVAAHVGPDLRGVLLGLVELHQAAQRPDDAIACLRRLRRLEPDDVVAKLSLAELLLDAHADERAALREVTRLGAGVGNETPVHAALLLYHARALRGLGLPVAARDVLTKALRRRKDRDPGLLRALRYERVLAYEDLGRKGRARAELEKLYAEAPDYADVASRLGLSAG